jgi:hypothetical protein
MVKKSKQQLSKRCMEALLDISQQRYYRSNNSSGDLEIKRFVVAIAGAHLLPYLTQASPTQPQ